MPNPIDMSVIQAAIDRRRGMQPGAPIPAADQTTGAAAAPGQGTAAPAGPAAVAAPPPSAAQSVMTQRAQGSPTPTEESPGETRIIAKLLIERLRKLL